MLRTLIALIIAAFVGACASVPMEAQQPTLANVVALRGAETPALGLGTFELAPGLPKRMDKSITIRASTLNAPGDGSFANYLKETFKTELVTAGKLDTAGQRVLSAQLTKSSVSTELPNSRGELGARFILTVGGEAKFDREFVVTDEWPSNFIGAIAIPTAMDRYTALYPAMVAKVFADPDFRAALGQP